MRDKKRSLMSRDDTVNRPPRSSCPNCHSQLFERTGTLGLWRCANCKKMFQVGTAYKLVDRRG